MDSGNKKIAVIAVAGGLVVALAVLVLFLFGVFSSKEAATETGDSSSAAADDGTASGDAGQRDSSAGQSSEETSDDKQRSAGCDPQDGQLETDKRVIAYLGCPTATRSERENAWEVFVKTREEETLAGIYGQAERPAGCWDDGLDSPFTLGDLESAIGGRAEVALFEKGEEDGPGWTPAALSFLEKEGQPYLDSGGSSICLQLFLNIIEGPVLQRGAGNAQRRNDIAAIRGQLIGVLINNNNRFPDNEEFDADVLAWVDRAVYTSDAAKGNNAFPTTTAENEIYYSSDRLGQATEAEFDRQIGKHTYPDPHELYIIVGAICQAADGILAGGNQAAGITHSASTAFAAGDLEIATLKTVSFIYQLEGESNARCEDNA